MHIHHLGYAVDDIDTAINSFYILGYEFVSKTVDEKRDVVIAFIRNGDYMVELISPLNQNAPVINVLKKYGPTPYHICYETASLDEEISKLKMDGWVLLRKREKAIAINGSDVVFLYNKSVGLIEIVETIKGEK